MPVSPLMGTMHDSKHPDIPSGTKPAQFGNGTMKKDIHPDYHVLEVKCGCGNSFTTRSTLKELKVDICNACHPFYTGKLKFVDTTGRIEKFKNKFSQGNYASLAKKKKKKPTKAPGS